MEKKIQAFTIEHIVYDETEYFRSYDDPLFNYPFAARKTVIDNWKLGIPEEGENYAFFKNDVKFSRMSVCLEGNIYD